MFVCALSDKPAISISSPSFEEVSKYLPPPNSGPEGAGYCSSTPSSSSKLKEPAAPPVPSPPSPMKGAGKPSTPPGNAKGAKGAAAAAAPAPLPVDTDEQQAAAAEAALVETMQVRRGRQPYELMRQRRQDEVDARKRNNQVSKIRVIDNRLMNYNKQLLLPVYFEQKM
jgi:hypothetical protein